MDKKIIEALEKRDQQWAAALTKAFGPGVPEFPEDIEIWIRELLEMREQMPSLSQVN